MSVGATAVLAYGALLAVILVYGANTALMVAVHAWGYRRPEAAPLPPDLPRVLVQLPVYNERHVVARLMEAAAALDWPADRLEIQLLDDSDDETTQVAAEAAARLPIAHLRRGSREGFKAGALAWGMARSQAELIAIFDADFLPPRDFLRRAVGRFADPRVAVVQGRWTHLNRGASGLTRAEALAIDGHFGVEQAARQAMGWFLNFNGSAGIWRRAAIDDAGGWSGDTLTEDLDLSYRAQLRGWRLFYDDTLACPAELPELLTGFKSQQRRWATGSMQVARKLLPAVWRSDASFPKKVQATLHLTHYAVHLLVAISAVASVPALLLSTGEARGWWGLVFPFLLAMSGPAVLHVYAQRHLERRWLRPRDLGLLTLYGMGIAVSNAVAVLAAFRPATGEFVRTPKSGGARSPAYRGVADRLPAWEAATAAWCALAAAGLVAIGAWEVAPFLLLDAAAFGMVAALGHAEARA